MIRQRHVLALGLAVFAVWPAARAEVSVDLRADSRVNTLVLAQIVEGPDPIGVWRQLRAIPQEQILNASGDVRGDGPPSLSSFPDDRPIAVWAYKAGPDHDVALAEWTGTEWAEVEYVTVGTDDELDPRVVVEADGTVHVVWWVDAEPDRVMIASRAPGAPHWSIPVQVTSSYESGRRPSVVTTNGVLEISYERNSLQPGAAQEVVVVRREASDVFVVETVAASQRTDRLDTILHFENDRVWLDWIHDAADFGRSEWSSGTWSGPLPTPSVGSGWVGVEETRKAIRRLVLD